MGESLSLGPRITGDHHYALLEHVLPMCSGVAVEAGVGSGESTRIIARHMQVIGLDGFTGLQEDWRPEYPRGSFATQPPSIPNVHLVIGLFEDTLPTLHITERIGLLHLDADTYTATKTVLDYLAPRLVSGAIVVLDEFHGYDDGPGARAEDHEQKAWLEAVEKFGLEPAPVGHSHEAAAFQIVSTPTSSGRIEHAIESGPDGATNTVPRA